MVIAPARTGSDKSKSVAVIITAHVYNLLNSIFSLATHKLKNVVIKFKAPKIDLVPAKCREKITKSTPSLG